MPFLPMAGGSSKESQLPVWIPTSTANPSSLIVCASRYFISICKFGIILFAQILDGLLQLFRNTFVSSQTKYPVVLCLLDCELFLGAESRPPVCGHFGTTCTCDGRRRIRRFRVYDNNFIS